MPLHPLLLALLALSGCAPSKALVLGDSGSTDGSSDSADSSTGDDSGETDSAADAITLSDLAWTVDPDIQSLIRLTWTQSAAATVYAEWSFNDGEWQRSPITERGAGAQGELLLGIPYATSATVRVVADAGDGPIVSEEVTATTGALPPGLPLPELLVADSSAWEPTGKYLLGSINQDQGGWNEGRYWMFLIDRQGRFVWAKRGVGDYSRSTCASRKTATFCGTNPPGGSTTTMVPARRSIG